MPWFFGNKNYYGSYFLFTKAPDYTKRIIMISAKHYKSVFSQFFVIFHFYDHSFPLRYKAPKGMKHRCH